MRILIAGAHGQLGEEFQQALKTMETETGALPGVYEGAEVVALDSSELDITDADATRGIVSGIDPDLVINCAGFTDVDASEDDEQGAFSVNAQGARNLASAAELCSAKFVQVSTDYVFSGDEGHEYGEEESPAPLNVYGRSKAEGERCVQASCSRHFILRTSWLYGGYGKNFMRTILEHASRRGRLTVVDDQRGNPTYTSDFVFMALSIAATDSYGIYHCSNSGVCSWFEFATEIVRLSGDSCEVVACSSDEYAQRATRPAFSALSHDRIESMGIVPRPWQDALRSCMAHYSITHAIDFPTDSSLLLPRDRPIRVLVTGANGYIGSNVVKALLDLGAKVTAVCRHSENVDRRAEVIGYDVLDSDADAYEKLGRPDVCIHLAWRNGFAHNDASHMHDLPGHLDFLTNLVSGGLKHVAVMGSMHEIGYMEGAIDENTPANPQSYYGIAKNALRQSLEVLAGNEGISFQWLRGYYIYGQDERNHSVFTKLLQAAERGQKQFPFNSGTNQYDFIDVEDLAFEIALTALQTGITGIVNCCSGKPVALGVFADGFIRDRGLDVALQYGMFPDRPYDSPVVFGDGTRIKQIMRGYLSHGELDACPQAAERARALLKEMS